MRHNLLGLQSVSAEEIKAILLIAKTLKRQQESGIPHRILQGKTLTMIFQKPSNRTRLSFEIGAFQLGAHALYVSDEDIKMGVRESIPDIARTMSRFTDMIMIRALDHRDIVQFAKHATVPVINGLSDLYHPCQGLADLMTIKEKKGRLDGINILYIGDPNNVWTSLANGAKKCGANLHLSCPKAYLPSMNELEGIHYIENPLEAAKGVDVIYTDVWASMGQEEEAEKRRQDFKDYVVNKRIMSQAKSDAIFMHCLPAIRGEEVDDSVIESAQSVVFDQAENRMHAQKAIMTFLGGKNE